MWVRVKVSVHIHACVSMTSAEISLTLSSQGHFIVHVDSSVQICPYACYYAETEHIFACTEYTFGPLSTGGDTFHTHNWQQKQYFQL